MPVMPSAATDAGGGNGPGDPSSHFFELRGETAEQGTRDIFSRLSKDRQIVVVRRLPQILAVRSCILDYVASHYSAAVARELEKTFFDGGQVPAAAHVGALVTAMRHIRDTRALPCLFSDFIAEAGFPQPVSVDCGHFRLVLPAAASAALSGRKDLFEKSDWEFKPSDDGVEPMLMAGAASPHRDFNRPHFVFQTNIWFPLIDLEENEALLFFPDADDDYNARLAAIAGGDADVKQAVKRLRAGSGSPDQWGFGRAVSTRLNVGDMVLFHGERVHGSPPRTSETLRLSVEIRVAARCTDDNASYRRIFSQIDNFYPPADCAGGGGTAVARARALVGGIELDARSSDSITGAIGTSTCAQLYFNALFETPAAARIAMEVSGGDERFQPAARLDADTIRRLVALLRRFPRADDRTVAVVRLLLRADMEDAARDLLLENIENSESYFWQLRYVALAIRARDQVLARKALHRCRELARTAELDPFPFARPTPTPAGPVIALLPQNAVRAADAIAASLDQFGEDAGGAEFALSCDSRLFHSHQYLLRSAVNGANIYFSGNLIVAIPAGRPFVPADVVARNYAPIAIGESEGEVQALIEQQRELFLAAAAAPATATATAPEGDK